MISGRSSSNGASIARAKSSASCEEPLDALDEVLDRGEVEAVALQLLDQPQARDVLGPVVAGAGADLGRRQQPARLVRADVADRHAGLARELVDRQLRDGLGHVVTSLRCYM